MSRFAITSLAICLFAAHALTPSGVQAQDAARPEFDDLRHEEDWANAKLPEEGGDFYDRIKRIALDTRGAIWLGFGGDLRVRGEGWSNVAFGSPEENDAILGLGRARLYMDFWASRVFRLFVEGGSALATARALPGGKRPQDQDYGYLGQGFIDLSIPLPDRAAITLRTGRQELAYGARRLVSPSDFRNVRQAFDAVRLIGAFGSYRFEAFYARPVVVDPEAFNLWSEDQWLSGVHAAIPVDFLPSVDVAEVYSFWFHDDESDWQGTEAEEDRYTVGARVRGTFPTGWFYDVEGGYQFGSHGQQTIDAGFFASRLGLAPNARMKPRAEVGFDYGTGDKDGSDSEVNTFSSLFGDDHLFFGATDVAGRNNSVVMHGHLSFQPVRGLRFAGEANVHFVSKGTDRLYDESGDVVRAPDGEVPSFVGFGVEIEATYVMGRHSSFEARYGHFFARNLVSATGNDEDIDAGYLEYLFRF